METTASKKIRVTFVINDFLVGGAQKLLVDVLSNLDKRAFEPLLVTLFSFPGRETLYQALPPGIRVKKLAFRGATDIASWRALAGLLARERPQVVSAHLFFANAVTRVIGAFLRYPTIVTIHNTYKMHTFGQILVDKLLSYATAKIVAVSETVKAFTSAQERIPFGKFVVIPNGIDITSLQKRVQENDRASTLAGLGLDLAARYVVSVARMTPQKNIPLLVDAFDAFSQRCSQYQLLVVGGGGMLEDMRAYAAAKRSASRIHFFGSRTDVHRFLAVADFFVSTSDIEGFGIAHIEAMACGLPVVTTKTAGPDQFVIPGENGFFVESSVASVAAGLERAATAERARLGKRAQEEAARFDVRETVRRYESLLEAVTRT